MGLHQGAEPALLRAILGIPETEEVLPLSKIVFPLAVFDEPETVVGIEDRRPPPASFVRGTRSPECAQFNFSAPADFQPIELLKTHVDHKHD
ncbi:hypothetical protein AAE478_001237 [Parahypoxylon ruwenzoriense]